MRDASTRNPNETAHIVAPTHALCPLNGRAEPVASRSPQGRGPWLLQALGVSLIAAVVIAAALWELAAASRQPIASLLADEPAETALEPEPGQLPEWVGWPCCWEAP